MRNMKKNIVQRLKLTARRSDVSELKYDEHKYYFSCSEETGSRLKMLWCLKRIYLGIPTHPVLFYKSPHRIQLC